MYVFVGLFVCLFVHIKFQKYKAISRASNLPNAIDFLRKNEGGMAIIADSSTAAGAVPVEA